jgi:hypothetical protein
MYNHRIFRKILPTTSTWVNLQKISDNYRSAALAVSGINKPAIHKFHIRLGKAITDCNTGLTYAA